ncbi:hypothetical protein [Cyanobium sp. ATX 6F1]|uniref:hypothetical protein n=1 Tax=unclassified Cyanobium TaxID=2627006 RepID=UPI0020CCE218|nr:hypothetical protein [Cyanobium sp. ATX 6F1]MCP9916647.1 hypothetical protein [Cyanobium sp. ATX 6F1]
MNRNVINTLVLRGWSFLSGILAFLAIPFFLDTVEQGYYFTFYSLIALQVFFELGLGQVLIYIFSAQHASQSDGKPRNNPDDNSQFATLLSTRLVYRAMALGFFVVSTTVGFVFFSKSSHSSVDWMAPWLMLSAATAWNLAQSGKLTYLEAIGCMADVSAMRTKQSIFGSLFFLLALSSGLKLWAAVAIPLTAAMFSTYWLYQHPLAAPYRKMRQGSSLARRDLLALWKVKIFPMQWKISLSWISGYFIFQLFTPIAFRSFGPAVAGRLGLIMNVMSSLLVVGSTFTTALAPDFAKMIANGEFISLDCLFFRSLRLSIISLVLVTQGAALGALFGVQQWPILATRILDPVDIWLIATATLFIGITYCLSIYLRAHRDEPLLMVSIFTALAMLPVLIIGSRMNLSTMLLGYSVVSLMSCFFAFRVFKIVKASHLA